MHDLEHSSGFLEGHDTHRQIRGKCGPVRNLQIAFRDFRSLLDTRAKVGFAVFPFTAMRNVNSGIQALVIALLMG
jgi:hypothetical protein